MIKTIFRHRSVRSYKSDPVDERLLERILEAGVRASNTGNMQVYSVVVTTVTLGWPEEMPPLTDRLPLEGVVHRERYEDYTPETIDRIWAEREASPETAELLRANGLPNLARIFTERRYTAEDNRLFSRKYFDMLKKQGFFNQ